MKKITPLFILLHSASNEETFRMELEISQAAKSRLQHIKEYSGEQDITGVIITALLVYDQIYRDMSLRKSLFVGSKNINVYRNLILKI